MSWSTYIPIELPSREHMTEEEFFQFCLVNKHLKIERDENKQILIMPPAGLESDFQTGELFGSLYNWNKKFQKGKCFGPSAGFTLPDTSVRSPDAAWLTIAKWESLSNKEKKVFSSIVPDFVAEVMSPSDSLKDLQDKMLKWIKNGVRLGWLIYPKKKLSYIYRADGTVTKIKGFDNTLLGEDVLEDFSFNLSLLSES